MKLWYRWKWDFATKETICACCDTNKSKWWMIDDDSIIQISPIEVKFLVCLLICVREMCIFFWWWRVSLWWWNKLYLYLVYCKVDPDYKDIEQSCFLLSHMIVMVWLEVLHKITISQTNKQANKQNKNQNHNNKNINEKVQQ